MQIDFHYYAAFCAAFLAGYTPEECLNIAYADQFTDICSVDMLKKMNAPVSAATTQTQNEMVNHRLDLVGLQEITRIWSSFHFLPRNLYAEGTRKSNIYLNKYRLICGPNGPLVKKTVELAKGSGPAAAGLAMHILSDTWAHTYFAGTPSFVINNTDFTFYELLDDGTRRPVHFVSNPALKDNINECRYVNSMYTTAEKSVMNLGHGRAGHLPDYSFIRYEYMPAWGNYAVIEKDNPADYYHAFCQMIYALKFLHGAAGTFETDRYDFEAAAPYEDRIRTILTTRQLDSSADWKAFGEELTGCTIPPFDAEKYPADYQNAGEESLAGQFILAALKQKSMVTGEIFRSKNLLAGFAVNYREEGFKGIRDYTKLISEWKEEEKK